MANIVRKELIDQYKKLHDENREYGKSSNNKIALVSHIVKRSSCRSVLDYGCGKSSLMDQLSSEIPQIEVVKYDPAIAEFSQKPDCKFDFAVCTDVMEHIPEEDVSDVLSDVHNHSELVLFVISTRPARAILPNGQNAHATVRDPRWWQQRLATIFGPVSLFYYNQRKQVAYYLTCNTSPAERFRLRRLVPNRTSLVVRIGGLFAPRAIARRCKRTVVSWTSASRGKNK